MIMNIMPLNHQTIHASIERYFLHKTSEFSGDSGNIKNTQDAISIRNNF